MADLTATNLPTLVFTHQLLHRSNSDKYTIKNAASVRKILEADGQVLAIFSGHDHHGEIYVNNSIHYYVLKGNVGIGYNWFMVSKTNGLDASKDCPFAMVETRLQG